MVKRTLILSRDYFNNVGVDRVAGATMGVIDRVQSLSPDLQVAALAASFLMICERYDIPAQDVFTVVNNIMNHAEGRRPEFAAVRQYMEEEL